MEEFKTRTSRFHIDKYGIIHKNIVEGVNVEPEDVDEDQEMLVKLCNEKKALMVIHGNVYHTMTPEAIERLKVYVAKSRYATAIISTNLGVRIFVETISLLLKTHQAYQIFSTEADALKWLLAIKRNQEKKEKKRLHNIAVAPKQGKTKTSKNYEVHIDKNGILTKKIFSGAHIDLAIAKRAEQKAIKLAGNKKVLALIDRRASYTITKDALHYITKKPMVHYRIATALIAVKPWNTIPKSSASKAPKKAQVKVFNTKAEGIKWLLSLKNKKKAV